MKYPNAYQGIKKMFTAEILEIIASVCIFFAGIAAIVAAAGAIVPDPAESAGLLGGGLIAAAVLMAGFGVLSIIAIILLLVGLKRAGLDESRFNKGFSMALASLILSVAAAVLSTVNGGNNIFDDFATLVASILQIFAMLYVSQGISSLAEDLGDQAVAKSANSLYLVYSVLLIIEAIMRIVSAFLSNDLNMKTSSGVILMISSVIAIVAYIAYIVLLGKAKKMLSK